MADGVQAVFAREMHPVQVADVGEQIDALRCTDAVRQLNHGRIQLEHVEPDRPRLRGGRLPPGERGDALEEPLP